MAIAEIVEETDHIVLETLKERQEADEETIVEGMVREPEPERPAIELNEKTAKEAFSSFAAQQASPSMAALIRMFNPVVNGYEIKVAMHKANLNLTEPIKVEWQLFLRRYFSNNTLNLNLYEDDSVIEQTRAYTQKEKLDELAKEHPLMKELIRKLNLKLK